MSVAKPTLGYVSRSAAVIALTEQNKTPQQIAALIGIKVHTVYALRSAARQQKSELRFQLSVACGQDLAEQADRRGVSASALARQLLETVIGDDLVAAVLDDAGTPAEAPVSTVAPDQQVASIIDEVAVAPTISAPPVPEAAAPKPQEDKAQAASNIRPAPPALTAAVVGKVLAGATIPFHLRRQVLDQATAFLKARCVLVQVVDRNAPIRTYRVSGKREAMLAEDVIAHAEHFGFEAVLGA